MQGATKDALVAFINGDVNSFVSEQLPSAITGMATLLEANRSNFEETDTNIANSISS
jgi:hypothetical protein